MNNKINELKKICQSAVNDGVASAISCGIATGSREKGRVYSVARGRITRGEGAAKIDDKTLFDLASLTKPLATTITVMKMVADGKIDLENSLMDFFKDVPVDKANITVSRLLSHCAGFIPHEEFFLKISSANQIYDEILNSPLKYLPGSKSVYSDLGFIILGRIIEIVGKEGLASQVGNIYRQLGIKGSLGYLPALNFATDYICAGQMSRWRNRVVHGEVSDDNCYFMGSVAGHAGLFGDIRAVRDICHILLDAWQGRSNKAFIDRDILNKFFQKSPTTATTWGLGFDHPDEEKSSAGRLISKKSVGHLGYTGTSFWIDPDHDLVIVLLTNRVHPDPENLLIKEFRPFFHDRVMEIL